MKIALASDHGGFYLKEEIISHLKDKYEIINLGTNDAKSCDYPIYAKKAVKEILEKRCDRAILICGTGLGMQMTANRFKGIRAACVSDKYSAKMSRLHNNSNVLTLGARVVGFGLALEIVDIWLNTEFLADRHLKRIQMIEE